MARAVAETGTRVEAETRSLVLMHQPLDADALGFTEDLINWEYQMCERCQNIKESFCFQKLNMIWHLCGDTLPDDWL